MPTLLYVKNISKKVFNLPLLKDCNIQLNPDDLKTFPMTRVIHDHGKVLDECCSIDRFTRKSEKAVVYGYYDSSNNTYEDLLNFINNGVPFPNKVKLSALDKIAKFEIITEQDLAGEDNPELKNILDRLGISYRHNNSRSTLLGLIQSEMDRWQLIPADKRRLMTEGKTSEELVEELKGELLDTGSDQMTDLGSDDKSDLLDGHEDEDHDLIDKDEEKDPEDDSELDGHDDHDEDESNKDVE